MDRAGLQGLSSLTRPPKSGPNIPTKFLDCPACLAMEHVQSVTVTLCAHGFCFSDGEWGIIGKIMDFISMECLLRWLQDTSNGYHNSSCMLQLLPPQAGSNSLAQAFWPARPFHTFHQVGHYRCSPSPGILSVSFLWPTSSTTSPIC